MTNRFANIIVDISLEKLDRAFQYKIPEHLKEEIRVGMQVQVPFGKGERKVFGYVIELTDVEEFPVDKMKEIDSICEKSVPIESQLIKLASFMKKNYGGTMNQALKMVLPVKKEIREQVAKSYYCPLSKEEIHEYLAFFQKKHQDARYRLLQAFIEEKEVSSVYISKTLKISKSVLDFFKSKGILMEKSQIDYRTPEMPGYHHKKISTLNEEQLQALKDLEEERSLDNRPCLLFGVTGSGKTEVYISYIQKILDQGKQAIVLIPEISLTFQTLHRFFEHFGNKVSLINSKMSQGERFDQFTRAKKGEIQIMIGPRSALFTPFPNLGCIIIDEEHEGSYKSETKPCYHAREVAIERVRLAKASLILGSATPSIESYKAAKEEVYRFIQLKNRVDHKPMAEVLVADLREELKAHNYSIFSRVLKEKMELALKKGEQIMLFLNRRGMVGFVSCRECGKVIKCPHCDVSMTIHDNGKMKCHYCNYEIPKPTFCPSCGSKYISGFKAGTQKIETLVKKEFPGARVLRMDKDTTSKKGSYEKILLNFSEHKADILIGTQMIVKGHDFSNVTLVGVLAADLSLNVSDYRAGERTFQLLTQAAGRAGRGSQKGQVVIQTYQPDHYSILAAKEQDYEAFYQEEIFYREMGMYPPAMELLVLHLTGEQEESLEENATKIYQAIKEYVSCHEIQRLRVIGPATPAIAKIKDLYRKRIYLKHKDHKILIEIKDHLEAYIKGQKSLESCNLQFDFNPMNGF